MSEDRSLEFVDVLMQPSLADDAKCLLEDALATGSTMVCAGTLAPNDSTANSVDRPVQNLTPPPGLTLVRGVGLLPVGFKTEPPDAQVSHCLAQLDEPGIALLSEVGLDQRRAMPALDVQEKVLTTLLAGAIDRRLPVLLHAVRAQGALLRVLDAVGEASRRSAAVHGFMGSAESAEELLRRGLFISFGPGLLSEQARQVKQSAKVVPDDRLLVESDAPSHPASSVRAVVERLAELRGQSAAEVASNTADNARRWLQAAPR